MPPALPPPWAPKCLARPSRRQRSSSFSRTTRSHAHHCSCLSKAAWWPWPFDLESCVRVTCDVGYLCANFGFPRPLCSWLRPDGRGRQTDRGQTKASLNTPPIGGGGIISKHRGGFPEWHTRPSCWTRLAMLNITSNIKKTVYNTSQLHVNIYVCVPMSLHFFTYYTQHKVQI